MEILLTITYTVLFIFIIHKMKFFDVEGITKMGFSMLFLLKISCGIALWAIYTFYYTDRATADIYKYFDDSKVISNALSTRPADYFKILFGIGNNTPEFDHYYSEMHYWARKVDSSIYNDSHTIIRFNALVRLFSFGYYNVHTVFICFLSLIGLTAIYKTFVTALKDKKRELLFAVFLLPSVLFWGSGVLKEGIIFFTLGLMIYYSTKLFGLKAISICIAAALLLAVSKFYVWLAILPGIILLVWAGRTTTKYIFAKYLTIIVVLTTVGLNIESFTSIQSPLVTLSQKQIEFQQLATGNLKNSENEPIPPANSLIHINKLEPTLPSFIRNSPQALVNTFLRPYIWEINSPFMLLSSLETFFMILLIILFLFTAKKTSSYERQYMIFCFSFVIIQFLIIGETTPVLGAIARYKTIALPFLMIAFLFVYDKDKLIKRLPFLKRILN